MLLSVARRRRKDGLNSGDVAYEHRYQLSVRVRPGYGGLYAQHSADRRCGRLLCICQCARKHYRERPRANEARPCKFMQASTTHRRIAPSECPHHSNKVARTVHILAPALISKSGHLYKTLTEHCCLHAKSLPRECSRVLTSAPVGQADRWCVHRRFALQTGRHRSLQVQKQTRGCALMQQRCCQSALCRAMRRRWLIWLDRPSPPPRYVGGRTNAGCVRERAWNKQHTLRKTKCAWK